MISIISMMSSPNDESPANIDAAKQWRGGPGGVQAQGGARGAQEPGDALKPDQAAEAPARRHR